MEFERWGGKEDELTNVQRRYGMERRLRRHGWTDDSSRVHFYRKEGLSELGVLVVDTIYVVHCVDEGGDVDLMQARVSMPNLD